MDAPQRHRLRAWAMKACVILTVAIIGLFLAGWLLCVKARADIVAAAERIDSRWPTSYGDLRVSEFRLDPHEWLVIRFDCADPLPRLYEWSLRHWGARSRPERPRVRLIEESGPRARRVPAAKALRATANARTTAVTPSL